MSCERKDHHFWLFFLMIPLLGDSFRVEESSFLVATRPWLKNSKSIHSKKKTLTTSLRLTEIKFNSFNTILISYPVFTVLFVFVFHLPLLFVLFLFVNVNVHDFVFFHFIIFIISWVFLFAVILLDLFTLRFMKVLDPVLSQFLSFFNFRGNVVTEIFFIIIIIYVIEAVKRLNLPLSNLIPLLRIKFISITPLNPAILPILSSQKLLLLQK